MAWADTFCGDVKPRADGPYLFYNEDGSARMVSIGQEGNILDTVFVSGLPGDFSVRVEGQSGKYAFDVPVVRKCRPQWNYRQARRTFIVSDPHGKMDIFVELLMRNGIVDKGRKVHPCIFAAFHHSATARITGAALEPPPPYSSTMAAANWGSSAGP